jgi:hypothetical protein
MNDNMMTSVPPLTRYISFEASDEARTWVFDVTFLTSSWSCIFGAGCPGVLSEPAPEHSEGCCSYGAHLVDDDDAGDVLAAAARLSQDQWQHRAVALSRGGPLRKGAGGARQTRMVGGACIFLNRPGFAGGTGCALHQGALDADDRPMDWKPDVCWQLPLRLTDHVEDSGHVVSTLRHWKRRDWGEGGEEFHWWCTESGDAFVGDKPVYLALRDEIVELVGEWAYRQLVDYLTDDVFEPADDRRTEGQPVAISSRSTPRHAG